MGIRNFAVVVEDYKSDSTHPTTPTYHRDGTCSPEYQQYVYHKSGESRIIYAYLIDLGTQQPHWNAIRFLDQHQDLWDSTDVFLIEKQMAYGKQANIIALRMSQHILTYFSVLYGRFKSVIEFDSFHKTRVLGCPYLQRKKKVDRKKFTERLTEDLLTRRNDDWLLYYKTLKKKNDIADCICQALAWRILTTSSYSPIRGL